MKKKIFAKRISNKKGFSLLEVLLAIVILGLIAAPILQIFVTSARINNNSKKIMGATDVANMTMEYITSLKFDGEGGVKEVFTENGASPEKRIPAIGYYSNATDLGTSWGNIGDFRNDITTNHYGHSGSNIYYNSVTGDQYLGVAINDIQYNNFSYEMIIWFEATNNSETYYTYDVILEVYGEDERVSVADDGTETPYTANFGEKLIVVNGAVANQ